MFALVSYRDGTPIVVAGPCWPFCVFVTVPLIIGISGAVIYFLIIEDEFTDLVCCNPIFGRGAFRIIFSHAHAASFFSAVVAYLCLQSDGPRGTLLSILCVLQRPWPS